MLTASISRPLLPAESGHRYGKASTRRIKSAAMGGRVSATRGVVATIASPGLPTHRCSAWAMRWPQDWRVARQQAGRCSLFVLDKRPCRLLVTAIPAYRGASGGSPEARPARCSITRQLPKASERKCRRTLGRNHPRPPVLSRVRAVAPRSLGLMWGLLCFEWRLLCFSSPPLSQWCSA